jgi:hypothetical protein
LGAASAITKSGDIPGCVGAGAVPGRCPVPGAIRRCSIPVIRSISGSVSAAAAAKGGHISRPVTGHTVVTGNDAARLVTVFLCMCCRGSHCRRNRENQTHSHALRFQTTDKTHRSEAKHTTFALDGLVRSRRSSPGSGWGRGNGLLPPPPPAIRIGCVPVVFNGSAVTVIKSSGLTGNVFVKTLGRSMAAVIGRRHGSYGRYRSHTPSGPSPNLSQVLLLPKPMPPFSYFEPFVVNNCCQAELLCMQVSIMRPTLSGRPVRMHFDGLCRPHPPRLPCR